jgi:tetratricopeptide (TPR) repeat protein
MKTTKLPLITVLFTFLLALIPVLSVAAGELPPFKEWHNKLRDAVYNNDTSIGTINLYYLQAREAVRSSDLDGQEKHYWLSRVAYLMGRAEQYLEHKDKAYEYYETALDDIEAALETGAFSEGYRMKSEIISQMCLVKKVGFIIANGPKVGKFAEKALELDPRNGKAIIIQASAKVYPPPIYGGNPEKGIKMMKKASGMPDIEKDDRFNIYSGIGVCYKKMDQPEKAARWLEKALELYPQNEYANEQYEQVK